MPFVVSPSARLRTGLSNHERPFDGLRANGLNLVFGTKGMAIGKREAVRRRHDRVRKNVRGTPDCPRLCVFRSLSHTYAQVIDDNLGQTLASASTLDGEIKGDSGNKTKTERAAAVGNLVGKRAQGKGISQVVFDRGGYKYHGRVKALADGARESGLRF